MEIMQRTAICRVNQFSQCPLQDLKIIILNLLKNEFSTLTLGLCTPSPTGCSSYSDAVKTIEKILN
jgi:hypothetical protein